jgi:hypothetical protein
MAEKVILLNTAVTHRESYINTIKKNRFSPLETRRYRIGQRHSDKQTPQNALSRRPSIDRETALPFHRKKFVLKGLISNFFQFFCQFFKTAKSPLPPFSKGGTLCFPL